MRQLAARIPILIYPVITLQEPFAHAGVRRNLLGSAPDEDMIRLLSSDLQVSPAVPPTFLVHGSADEGVPCENSLLMAGRSAGHASRLSCISTRGDDTGSACSRRLRGQPLDRPVRRMVVGVGLPWLPANCPFSRISCSVLPRPYRYDAG